MKIKICHMYHDLLDLYGDRGNILTLVARCQWRGIEAEVCRKSIGEEVDFSEVDILFIGGGSDREQNILVEDLLRRKDNLTAAIEQGLVVLLICGGYQLLGKYYQTGTGTQIPGLGVLDVYTVAGAERLIGNVIVELGPELSSSEIIGRSGLSSLVGFENHSGRTYLGAGLVPLGRATTGNGNNGQDRGEGVRYRNVFGTYLHGPLLPKNPHFADLLLQLALERRGYEAKLSALEDQLELRAHQAVVERFHMKQF